MEHSYFKDRVSAFIDGELPPYEEQVVGEHLAACEECQKIKADLEKIDSLVEKHSGLDGDEYWEKSAQKIENRLGLTDEKVEDVTPEKRSKYKGLGWKLATVAASVAILTFIGLHEKDIFKNVDTTPKMKAPAINIPPSDSSEDDDLVQDEEVVEEPALVEQKTTAKKKEIDQQSHNESTEQKELESPKAGIPKPVADNIVNLRSEDKAVNDRIDSVSTVEDFIEQVEGVTTNTQGEVFYRSGEGREEKKRLNEKDESSTTVNVQMEPKTTKIENTIKVTGKQDQLKIYETANQSTITREDVKTDSVEKESTRSKLKLQQSATVDMEPDVVLNSVAPEMAEIEAGSIDSTKLLNKYVNRRDSLLTTWKRMKEDDKKLKIKSALQKVNKIDVVERQLLSSYYNVAIMAKDRDEEEFNSAVEFLKEYSKNSQSRSPVDARNYLKRLGIIDF